MSIYITKDGEKRKVNISATDVQLLDIDGRFKNKNLEDALKEVGSGTETNMNKIEEKVSEHSTQLKENMQKIDFVNDVKKGDYCYTNNITLLRSITFNTQFYLGGASGVTDIPNGETTAGAFFKCEVVYKASGVPQHIVQTFKKIYANKTYTRTCDNSANNYNWTDWKQLATDDSGWIDLPLLAGSINSGFTPQYRKVGNEVRLRGRIMGLTGVSTIATLPTGYRPSQDVCFTIPMSGTAYAKGVILANGSVKIDNLPSGVTSSHHFIIDSMSFLNN